MRLVILEDGKPISELRSSDNFWRMQTKWMKKRRVIDWKAKLYRETLTDPQTGEIVHQCDEPLDLHQGHGSAKKRARA